MEYYRKIRVALWCAALIALSIGVKINALLLANSNCAYMNVDLMHSHNNYHYY